MAPSPTGHLHIGTARTALFNWLYARKHDGVFILRIEDTDKERSKKEYEDELIDGLHWLGIEWDEFGRQSDRTALYHAALEQLLASGDAYYCYCTKEDLEAQRQAMLASGLAWKYNGHCRPENLTAAGKDLQKLGEPQVIRIKVPEIKIEFKDLIRGKVVFDAALFGDQPIAKDLDTPLFNFANVVDDADMKISHVIRGEDLISSTPRQIVIQRALGYPELIYAHIPLILNADKSKMSKREGNAALLGEYREMGYLPEAIMNFLALLGWHPKDDREVLAIEDLIKEFDLERVQKSGAVFSQDKLNSLNREHIKKYSSVELAALAMPFVIKKHPGVDMIFLEKLVAVERTRANTLVDFSEIGEFFFKLPEYDAKLLIWKEAPKKDVRTVLEKIHNELQMLDPSAWHKDTISAKILEIIGEGNRGTVLWPLRVALSGQQSSPDPIDIMEVLGDKESLVRIESAIKKLS